MSNEFVPDFTHSGKELLVDLINWCNRQTMTTKLKPSEVWFTTPIKLGPESDYNTSIKIANALGFMIPQNTEEILYNRLDISQLAKLLHFNNVLVYDFTKTLTTTHQLLPILYEQFKVKLLPEDVELELIDIDLEELERVHKEYTLYHNEHYDDMIDEYYKNRPWPKVKLKITDKSYAYYGELELEIHPKPLNIEIPIKQRRLMTFMPLQGFKLG